MMDEQTKGLMKMSTGELLEMADYIIRSERSFIYGEFPTIVRKFKAIIDQGNRTRKMGTLGNISKIIYERSVKQEENDEEFEL